MDGQYIPLNFPFIISLPRRRFRPQKIFPEWLSPRFVENKIGSQIV